MALLSIAEPGQSAAPHQRRLAIGIDLGTTHSLVATVRNGGAVALADADGHCLLPSVVRYLDSGAIVVGQDARAAQGDDPFNTLASVKRLLGRARADLDAGHACAYRLSEPAANQLRIDTRAGAKSPIEVSAEILKALRERAEQALGGELIGAVITVPAYFDDAQRQATKDAARLAGLNVLRLLNEPTAAAVAYGLDRAAEGVYAIYDLGGGTFDISILRLSRGVFEVLAVNGDAALGGDDFDLRVCDWFLREHGLDTATLDASDRRRLLLAARASKEALSATDDTVLQATVVRRLFEATLTPAMFETMCADLIERTLSATRKALRDAGLKIADVDGVVLVGGSTRMPAVRHAVAAHFQREPLTDLDPDQVVALGAAVQADALAGNRGTDDLLLLDVTPLSLGIETLGGLVEKIIPRNSTLPLARAQEFTTFKDGQTTLALHVLQGERELAAQCRSLARFELRNIPPMAAGAARVRVTFQVDADGLLCVSAQEQRSGAQAEVTVQPSYGLDESEIIRMLQDANAHAHDDARARALQEQKVEAERTLEALRTALAADGGSSGGIDGGALLDAEERAAIEAAVAAVHHTLTGLDADNIRTATAALNRLTTPYAARRMDAAVRGALSGQSIQDLALQESR